MNFSDFYYYVIDFGVIAMVGFFILFAKNFNKFGIAYNLVVYYMFFILIIQITLETTTHLKIKNLFIANVFHVGEFYIISFFYYTLIKNKIIKKCLEFSIVFFTIMFLFQFLTDFSSILKVNTLVIITVSNFIIALQCCYLYEILNETKLFYYITIGGLIYHILSVFMFLGANLFYNKYLEIYNVMFCLLNLCSIIYLFFAYLEWKFNFSKLS